MTALPNVAIDGVVPNEVPSPLDTRCVLVRYGAMGEVGRFSCGELAVKIGEPVVVDSPRGVQLGMAFAEAKSIENEEDVTRPVLRRASEADEIEAKRLRERCEDSYGAWENRIGEWEVDLQLVDLEFTLEGEKQILYVLNDRGPETTTLALRAAAAGLGIVEVQPVGLEGVVETSGSGGCGSCGR